MAEIPPSGKTAGPAPVGGTPSSAGRGGHRGLGHGGEHLFGEATDPVEGVPPPFPGLDERPADADVGQPPEAVGGGVPGAQGDLRVAGSLLPRRN